MSESELILSVIVPNYNHAQYLESRVSSILAQLTDNMELVIVDDGSTDNSVEILEKYASQDARLKLIKSPKNAGVVSAANTAISASKGKYLVFFASDDIVLPNFFSKTLAVLKEHPEVPLCCSNFGYTTQDEPEIIKSFPLIKNIQHVTTFQGGQKTVKLFRDDPFGIPGHTTIVRRDSVLKKGGFIPEIGASCDWYLLHAIALEEGFAYLPETLSVLRVLPNSYSAQISRNIIVRNEQYLNMFALLLKGKDKKLYKTFKESRLLEPYIKHFSWKILIKKGYWGLFLYTKFSAVTRKVFGK